MRVVQLLESMAGKGYSLAFVTMSQNTTELTYSLNEVEMETDWFVEEVDSIATNVHVVRFRRESTRGRELSEAETFGAKTDSLYDRLNVALAYLENESPILAKGVLEGIIDQIPKPYDPRVGDHILCFCGHRYDRHFDGYYDNAPVGCKYCLCPQFKYVEE